LKLLLQVFLLLAFSLSATFANDFKYIKKISLKKDEQKKILVKYAANKRLFKFRWTLYKNDGLVIHRSYDRIVSQNMLYLRYQNQSFRLELRPRGDSYNVPYILVKFKEFDVKRDEAHFELLLSDENDLITLEYLKK